MNKRTLDLRLAYLGISRQDLVVEIRKRGIACNAQQLSRAINLGGLPSDTRIRGEADAITAALCEEMKHEIENCVRAELEERGKDIGGAALTVPLCAYGPAPVICNGRVIGWYSDAASLATEANADQD